MSIITGTGHVQNLRDRIYVWDLYEQRPRSLHSYVPFYFATLTPMLYIQFKNGIQNEIVIFEVSRSVLRDRGVLFTDGNASNQQFAKYGIEKVLVTPATVLDSTCRRLYFPIRQYGTNPNISNFYADTAFLELLNWDVINDRWFNEDEKRRIKHAEVLVPDMLPLGRVQAIYVNTWVMVQAVNALIEECSLTGRIPSATYKPNLYF